MSDTITLSCGHEHTEAEILSAAGKIYADRRNTKFIPPPGPGRPRQGNRCPCKANTLTRAQARGFDCCKRAGVRIPKKLLARP